MNNTAVDLSTIENILYFIVFELAIIVGYLVGKALNWWNGNMGQCIGIMFLGVALGISFEVGFSLIGAAVYRMLSIMDK